MSRLSPVYSPVYSVYFASGSTYTQVLYSPIGKLGLMNGQSANTIRIPLPGGSTAELLGATGASTHILHSDWLGSARLVTSFANREVVYETAYAPYGESYDGSSSDLSFTGQSQDTVSGLTDFLYRKYNPVQGRWISPDPSGLAAVDPSNPQSWNRYAYALNNPLSYIDPTGLFCVWDDGSYDSADDPGTGTASSCGSAGGNWFDGNPSDWGLNADWSSQANANFAAQWLNQQPDYTFQTQAWAAMPSDFSFTFGVLAPGQTFTQCMGANVNNYSMGGSLELGANVAFGFNSSVSSNPVVSTFTGNGVAGLMFGGGSDAAQTGLTSAPDLVRAGMGTVTTFGRNSTNIMALNIARVGGAPQALSSASSGAGSFLESASSFFSMGMKAGTRWAIDFALTGAEAIGCSIPRGY